MKNLRIRRAAGWVAAAVLATTAGLVDAVPARAVAPPSDLRATAVSSRAIALTWARTGADAYRVRFSKSSSMSSPDTWDVLGNYFEWTRTDASPTADAPRLSPGTRYYFQVKAIERAAASADRDDLSGYGPVLAVETAESSAYPELAPVQQSTTTGGADRLYVSWRSRGPGVAYVLRYSTDPNASVLKWPKVTLPAAGGTVTGLKASTTYYFRVRVVSRSGKALSGYSGVWSRSTPERTASPGISVVSYNILKTGSGPSWASRRSAVASTIKAQKPQVVALQEATPASVTSASGDRVPQYTDVLRSLGSQYSYVTSEGSSGTRLAYDTGRLNLVRADAVKLQTYGPAARYAVWAILSDRQSGKQFFVLNTHLEPGSNDSSAYNDVRVTQARQVVSLIENESKNLPVILAGDMNSSRAAKPENGQYRTFIGAGMVDPLDNATSSWLAGVNATAEHLLDVEYNAYNNLERVARRTSYPVGTNVDYIMVSRGVRVALWRTVVDVDTDRRFVGTIPSDHNLITAMVHLP